MRNIFYHGADLPVIQPVIQIVRYNKDFSQGFYCTDSRKQAERWAIRRGKPGAVSVFKYISNPELKVLEFPEMSDRWLDFIAACRAGQPHSYDIVSGPMSDDTIFNFLQDFIDGRIPREAFWALAKSKRPVRQISFHTQRALETLKFRKSYKTKYGPR